MSRIHVDEYPRVISPAFRSFRVPMVALHTKNNKNNIVKQSIFLKQTRVVRSISLLNCLVYFIRNLIKRKTFMCDTGVHSRSEVRVILNNISLEIIFSLLLATLCHLTINLNLLSLNLRDLSVLMLRFHLANLLNSLLILIFDFLLSFNNCLLQ